MPTSEDRPGRRLSGDLEAALDHAEKMLDAFDRASWRVQVLLAARVTVVVLVGVASGFVFLNVTAPTQVRVAVIGMLAAFVVLVGFGFRTAIHAVRRQRERDLSALVQVSRVVRDLLPVVAKQEQWSELKLLTARARIARFPISEGTR